jgi:ACS family sodium-dependent inorganic phosphate cotransporter
MVELNATQQLWRSKRYFVVLLTFLGYLNHSTRVNVSVAVVAMMDESIPDSFNWTSTDKGIVLSSFFYGYFWTHFLGGYLAVKYGGSTVFSYGVLVATLGSLITPVVVTNFGVWGFVVIRIIQGIAAALAFPCCHAIFSYWAPINERSRMTSLTLCGVYFGTVAANMFSGTIAVNWGWQSIYYIFGGIGVVWFVVFIIFVANSPETDRFISEAEKLYIIEHRGKRHEVPKPPWKGLFTSLPVLAITGAHFCFNWGYYTMFTDLPSYMKHTLKFDLEFSGFMSAIPYITVGLLMVVTGYMADWLKIKKYMTLHQVRKHFTCQSFIFQAILLAVVAFVSDPVICVTLITLSITIGAFSASGFLVNPLDIAPQYASIIFGISNTIATLSGIISPLFTNLIVTENTFEQWRIVFFVSILMYVIGAVIYWFLSSADVQKWAIVNSLKDDMKEIVEDATQQQKNVNKF